MKNNFHDVLLVQLVVIIFTFTDFEVLIVRTCLSFCLRALRFDRKPGLNQQASSH